MHSDDVMSCKILHEEYAEVSSFLTHIYIIQILVDRNVESLYMVTAVDIRQSKRRQCVLYCPAILVMPVCVVLSVYWYQLCVKQSKRR